MDGRFSPDLAAATYPLYVLTEDDWADIGSEMASATATVPVDMGRRPRDISKHHAGFKATEWSHWLMLYSVSLLKGRLPEPFLSHRRLHTHIYYMCGQTAFALVGMRDLKRMVIEWIVNFEDILSAQ